MLEVLLGVLLQQRLVVLGVLLRVLLVQALVEQVLRQLHVQRLGFRGDELEVLLDRLPELLVVRFLQPGVDLLLDLGQLLAVLPDQLLVELGRFLLVLVVLLAVRLVQHVVQLDQVLLRELAQPAQVQGVQLGGVVLEQLLRLAGGVAHQGGQRLVVRLVELAFVLVQLLAVGLVELDPLGGKLRRKRVEHVRLYLFALSRERGDPGAGQVLRSRIAVDRHDGVLAHNRAHGSVYLFGCVYFRMALVTSRPSAVFTLNR